MSMSTATLKGVVWRLWCEYFEQQEDLIPPLAFLKQGAGEDGFFVSSVSDTEIDKFVAAMRANPEVEFLTRKDWALDPSVWFGWWSVFLARPKTHTLKTPRVRNQINSSSRGKRRGE